MTSRPRLDPVHRQAGRAEGGPAVVYVSAAGLPTPMAHGYQTAKMCEAFALEGCDLTLLNLRRRYREIPAGMNLFTYYGIPEVFAVRALPRATLLGLRQWLGRFRAAVLHPKPHASVRAGAQWTADRPALLVPPGNADRLARAIDALLDQPELAARLSAQGLADAKQHTWRNRARTILTWMEMDTPSAVPRAVPTYF